MLRYLTAGESHGPSLTVIVEGLPAGLAISAEDFTTELARRRLGYGRGPRMRFEKDEIAITAGVRHGRTLGSPLCVVIANTEWPKWEKEMSAAPGQPEKKLTAPRPGHADLVGMQKYEFDDARDVLERASARETAARVVAGTCARLLLAEIGVSVLSHVVRLGVVASSSRRPGAGDREVVDASDVRCIDESAAELMRAEIAAAAKEGDSLGGVAEVLAFGVPVGLGSHVHWDRKIDGLLAQALMSIPAVKAIEIGDGWTQATQRGSQAHDAIARDDSATDTGGFIRRSDHAGGIEGGMTSGSVLSLRVAMKPLATLNRPVLETVDLATGDSAVSFRERTDVTAVPAMAVITESMVALVLAAEAQRKFGGDSVAEFVRNVRNAQEHLGDTSSAARPE